jgi:hypothetical protein
MPLDIEDAWNELVRLKDSWNERSLPADDAFILFSSMICRFALANRAPLTMLQKNLCDLMTVLYDDLKDRPGFSPAIILMKGGKG